MNIDFNQIDWNQVQSMAPFIFMGVILFLLLMGALLEGAIDLLGVVMQALGIMVLYPILLIVALVSEGKKLAKRVDRNALHAAVGIAVLVFVAVLLAWLR